MFLFQHMKGYVLPLGILGGIALFCGRNAQCEPAEGVNFNFQIRPLLSDRCFACHGPDAEQRQAGLRLDRQESATAPLESGLVAIRPGDPAGSEALRRVMSDDPAEVMPPPDSKLPPLTAGEIDALRRWIAEGARWSSHWSFVPIQQPRLPAIAMRTWPRHAIDHFVLAQLEREGLSPSPPATPEQWLRRVTFDLTGLPPTAVERQAFLHDHTPDAQERVVDRLLQSPRYGERMAADWMDVARYADSYGYQVDRERFVWPWRDWLIRSFNQNLSYDQFVLWQLAGDLLPQPTDDQILATTFNRLHPQESEGGSVEEEYRTEYVADRVHTMGTAFLGLTLECCRCHDHKYDPFAQREYYQLFAFFNNIDEAGLYSYFTESIPTPTLSLNSDADKRRIAAAQAQVERAEQQLKSVKDTEATSYQQWLRSANKQPEIPGKLAHYAFESRDGDKIANATNSQSPATISAANQLVPGKIGLAVRLTGDDAISTPIGNFSRNEPFSVALWLQTPDVKSRAVVFHRSAAWTDAGSRGYQLLIEEGKLSAALIHFWPGNAICVRTPRPIPTNEWLHVAMTYDGSSRASGLRIYINGQLQPCVTIRDQLTKDIRGGGGDHITIGERFRDHGFKEGLVDEFQVFDRQLADLEVAQIADGRSLADVLASSCDSPADSASLYDYYLLTASAPYKDQLQQVRAARDARSQAVDGVAEIMVMRELAERRPTYLLKRGAYNAPDIPVDPITPQALNPWPEQAPRNRLGLAQWLIGPDQPLTARVAANRLWQIAFGHGLVRTPEDFGSQGELPTHPELLEWLSADFRENGWDMKRTLKQIVLSATYGQDSQVSAELHQRDPQNRLLARGPSYRWPAEMIRDQSLATSGLMVERIGGPPARPYELSVSFKPVDPDKGVGLYRRSLYTFWKRTGPAPVMMVFDASKREVCTAKRQTTSTPLQALAMLNGPQFVEAARVLAQRLVIAHGNDADVIARDLFRELAGREPVAAELQTLISLLQQQHEYFQQNPQQAEQFLAIGDYPARKDLSPPWLAAVGIVANTMLNFDGTVVKR